MNLQEQYNKIVKEKKPKGFLTTIFKMCDPNEIDNIPFQFDFYNSNKDTVCSYIIQDEIIEVNKNVKIFKDEKTEMKQLEIKNIKTSYKNLPTEEILKKYNEKISKVIIILQEKTWNISYITTSLNLINIRIGAETNEILSETKESITSLKAK